MKQTLQLKLSLAITAMAIFMLLPGFGKAQVVISQVYGGGGNTGATYKNDFIELFNRGTAVVNISGWSVQYASATGTTWTATIITTGSVQPGQYFLIQEAAGSGGTTSLPTPDAIGTIAMSGTNCKVALVNTSTLLSGACPSGLVDLAGIGTANCFEGTAATPSMTNTTAVIRAANGCIDANQNSTDFATSTPNPRNTFTALNVCAINAVATPTFTPSGGNYYAALNVAISTSTTGATIHYSTTSSTGPWTDHTININISETTTIWAYATKSGMDDSPVASAIYNFPVVNNVTDIASLRAGATDGTIYKLTGQAILTYKTITNNVKYIQDGSGAIMIYDPSGKVSTVYNLYDGITGITGSLTLYQNMLEFIPVTDPGVATSSGNIILPEVVTLANLSTSHQAKLVRVLNATITGSGNFIAAINYPIADATGTGILRTAYSDLNYIGQPIHQFTQDITGVVLQYTATMQLVPRDLPDFSIYFPLTLNADLSAVSGFDPANELVYLAGDFPGAFWNEPGTNPGMIMSQVGTSLVYTITLQLPAGNYQYKFFRNASWAFGEWGGNPNRFIPVNGATVTNDIWGLHNTTWTGAFNSDWGNIGNWTNNVPDHVSNVTVPSGLTYFPAIYTPNTCKNLTISSGASLLDNSNLTVFGATTVLRDIDNGEWHLISSPVAGSLASMFTDQFLQFHSEPLKSYTDILDINTPLEVMKGYALWTVSNPFTAQFTGILNTGAVGSINNLTRSGADDPDENIDLYGWNLVGNPYPSSIDWAASSGWTKTNVDDAIYINLNNSTWATFVGGASTNGGSRYIAPCQGFFVHVPGPTYPSLGTLQMTNDVRVANTSIFFKEALANLVRLEVSGNGYNDEAVVRFVGDATNQFDGEYDAYKLFSEATEAVQIYTVGGKNLAINSMPETSSVPVGMRVGAEGVYTIAATEINDFSAVSLEDTKTGIITDLNNSTYSFSFAPGETETRFVLHFGPLSVNETENTVAGIYASHGIVYVNMKANTKADIYIYNIAGQLVAKSSASAGSNMISLGNTGNYIVKVISDKSTMVKKVFVQ